MPRERSQTATVRTRVSQFSPSLFSSWIETALAKRLEDVGALDSVEEAERAGKAVTRPVGIYEFSSMLEEASEGVLENDDRATFSLMTREGAKDYCHCGAMALALRNALLRETCLLYTSPSPRDGW